MKYKSGGRRCALRIVGITVLVILLLISNAAAVLRQECGDRNYIINTASHIVEGTVEKVESKWNEGNTSIYTFTNISIEKYVKGVPIPGNKVQITTYGGVIGEVKQWGEDQPDFREGKKVRVYLQEINEDFSLVCAEFGVEEIFTDNITSVSPEERWNKTFGRTSNDVATFVQQTKDGGYIIAGSGDRGAWLIKTDAQGNERWNKKFEGVRNFESVQQTSDGGYIVAGTMLIKTDANGNQQWNRTFGGLSEYFYSVRQTSDGGYVLVGFIMNGTYQDAWLIKTNASGTMQWSKIIGGAKGDYAYSIQPTRDGGYILAGSTASYGAGSVSAWLIKVGGEAV